jgi:putative endonuclease
MPSAAKTPEDLARQAQQKAIKRRRARIRAGRRPTAPTGRERLSASQQRGLEAETRACQYLEAHNVQILARNLSARTGEIDIAARENDTLLFVEVRHRNTLRFGGAGASVNRAKQARVIRTAQVWLGRLAQAHFSHIPPCRFDVITLDPDGIAWHRDAFRQD